ncbi:hypothetical protein E5D57_002331 [Metarhizium anisopliae]|nr:hypothetical protein E5D57_002331 [Metarhizium anisopliae]
MEEGKAGIYGGNLEMLDGSEEEDEAELMGGGGRCFQGSTPEGLQQRDSMLTRQPINVATNSLPKHKVSKFH